MGKSNVSIKKKKKPYLDPSGFLTDLDRIPLLQPSLPVGEPLWSWFCHHLPLILTSCWFGLDCYDKNAINWMVCEPCTFTSRNLGGWEV